MKFMEMLSEWLDLRDEIASDEVSPREQYEMQIRMYELAMEMDRRIQHES